ncbi:hypothetical protein [Arcanobacterium hippocoleae]|uniref:General secretion pathway GspH domain-containing protein n=1 Tax=Arcanobacterium hippocoleae TaxID=149017 RepID=A0ABU1T3M2_9ACTO|nr:hypothetical protein [Arcanobacterium hippocoleae]MDR6939904.1 hypothetical protein [Arcanobacterium hippocoleae]
MFEMGSLADWISAVGGLLAVIAASMSWKSSQRMLNIEQNRDSKRALAMRREQAELVFAVGACLPNRDKSEQWAIYIYNGSTKPIFDIKIESQKLDGRAPNKPLALSVIPPGQFVVPSHPVYHWGTLVDLSLKPEIVDLLVKGKGAGMITRFEFADSSHQIWTIGAAGQLHSKQ